MHFKQMFVTAVCVLFLLCKVRMYVHTICAVQAAQCNNEESCTLNISAGQTSLLQVLQVQCVLFYLKKAGLAS